MSQIACPQLPADTAQAARFVFGRDHVYIKVGEALSSLWRDLDFSSLQSADAFLSDSFYPCAPATVLQYWEELTDRQMSEATHTRLDIQYALHLPVSFPGIEARTLCDFRQRVLSCAAGRQALEGLMARLSAYAGPDKSEADLTRMMTAICLPSRAELILEGMDIALESVATRDPGWLRINAHTHWYRRYHPGPGNQRIPHAPEEAERLMLAVGEDGWQLLHAIEESQASHLVQLPEISSLRREWNRQFRRAGGSLELRPFCALTCESNLRLIPFAPNRGKEEAQ
jgi:hypothetical protein